MRYYPHYVHHRSAWFWVFSSITMLLLWLVLITLLVVLWRVLTHRKAAPAPWRGWSAPGPGAAGPPTPEQLLAERLARGEIEVEEYRRRLAALRGGPDSGPESGPESGP